VKPALHMGRPRLKELREAAGWTQQQLADKLAYFAWTRGLGHVGVNASMVAKWERGAKGISSRYQLLLCQLFGVTREQLGFCDSSAESAEPSPSAVRPGGPESLVRMHEQATEILDQLGLPTAPHLASEADAGRLTPAQAVTASPDDLDRLTARYETLYETADPAALLPAVAAHVRTTGDQLRADHGPATRRRLLRCLTVAATLAGRLAYDDLGDMLNGRAYLSTALDAARDIADHHAAGTALGHLARLAQVDGRPSSALAYLADAQCHAEHAPELAGWLATIAAAIHADRGDQPAADAALHQAEATAAGSAEVTAAAGYVQWKAGDLQAARTILSTALDALPGTARRARTLLQLDLALVELDAGRLPEACRHATTAAGALDRVRHATAAARLRQFRAHPAAQKAPPRVLRALDAHLGDTIG
jgi:transcriptional regulator with XRE-family HTH domain